MKLTTKILCYNLFFNKYMQQLVDIQYNVSFYALDDEAVNYIHITLTTRSVNTM